MTVQHVVHEPQDFPGTMAGAAAAFGCSPAVAAGAGRADAAARSALLRFASPIRINPIVVIVVQIPHVGINGA
jgi:hypothetical protein